ncbi:MAG: aspartate aminotransferase family protein [Lentimicrobium sp.]|jgi:acetylornithine/succinyldiaminopimelate/putrescine aminotransferase
MSNKFLSEREIFFRHLALTSLTPPAIQFSKAQGIYLFTADNRVYTDLSSGFSVCNIGHNHPVVVQAIHHQADLYLHQTVYGEFVQSPQVRLAEALVKILPPSLDCVYLVNSGAEAIEGAMKLAKRYTSRPRIVTFRNAYHGSTQGALSITGNEILKDRYRPLIPGIIQLQFNQIEDLNRIDETVAAVIIEPVQGEAGVVLPKPEFLHRLRQRCDETHTLLVFDEIQTGLGRTGSMFAFEKYKTIPDVLCLAKALGGGMPIGAFISSKNIMDTLAYDPSLGHITTFGGNPVSAAAACAVLQVLQNEINVSEADEKARRLINGIDNYKVVKEIRFSGLLIAVEFHHFTQADRALQLFWENCLISDRFLFCENALRISPPLCITFEECNEANKTLQLIFEQLDKEFYE